jgi:two-component system sensor histidine kinase YesM
MDKISKGTYEEKEYATYFDEFESLAYGFNTMSYELENLNKQMQSKYNEELKSEIEALRHQINPHFMCGTLEMIKRMAKIEHNEDTRMLSDALLTITEDNLTDAGITADIEHEISSIDAYMYIMKVRYDDSVEFIKDIDPSVLKAQIPSLMLQPLIDNSIFHGFKGIERDKMINLSIRREDDNLIITLRDNGKGVDKVKLTKLLEDDDKNHHSIKVPNHVGLKNINKRLSLLYPNSYSFTFYRKQHGDDSFFEQTITIPFSTEQR